MKRIPTLLLSLLMVLSLTACASKPTFLEQYQLGERYLESENYEAAVLAFTAAIEIDPRQPDPYLALADAYIGLGDYENAAAILEQALSLIDDERLQAKLDEVNALSGLAGSDTAADTEAGSVSQPSAEAVTVTGTIIYNPDEYQDTWSSYRRQYQDEENNIRCSINTYGVRFDPPVEAMVDGTVVTIDEAVLHNASHVFDTETQLHNYTTDSNGEMIGTPMQMTGTFSRNEQATEIAGPSYNEHDDATYYSYRPNGDFVFRIEGYGLLP